ARLPGSHAGQEVRSLAASEALEIGRPRQARIGFKAAAYQHAGRPGQSGPDDPAAPLGVEFARSDHIFRDIVEFSGEAGTARLVFQPGELLAGTIIRVKESALGVQDTPDLA